MTPPGSSAETPPRAFVEWWRSIDGIELASVRDPDVQRDWLGDAGSCWRTATAFAVAAERARCAKVALRLSKRTRTDDLFIAESGIEENMGKNIAAEIEQPEEER